VEISASELQFLNACENDSQLHRTAAHPAHGAYFSASFEPKSREGLAGGAQLTRPQFPRSGAKESFPLSLGANAHRLFFPEEEATTKCTRVVLRRLGLIKTKASCEGKRVLNCPSLLTESK
jgi:hypothetical protein